MFGVAPAQVFVVQAGHWDIDIVSYWGMASIRLYTLTVVFVLVEWNNAVFYSNTLPSTSLHTLYDSGVLFSQTCRMWSETSHLFFLDVFFGVSLDSANRARPLPFRCRHLVCE
jgi:hypothetical protein